MCINSARLVSIYRSSFLSQIRSNLFQKSNDVVTPRFCRGMLMVSRFQQVTELFFLLDTHELAR